MIAFIYVWLIPVHFIFFLDLAKISFGCTCILFHLLDNYPFTYTFALHTFPYSFDVFKLCMDNTCKVKLSSFYRSQCACLDSFVYYFQKKSDSMSSFSISSIFYKGI